MSGRGTGTNGSFICAPAVEALSSQTASTSLTGLRHERPLSNKPGVARTMCARTEPSPRSLNNGRPLATLPAFAQQRLPVGNLTSGRPTTSDRKQHDQRAYNIEGPQAPRQRSDNNEGPLAVCLRSLAVAKHGSPSPLMTRDRDAYASRVPAFARNPSRAIIPRR